VDFRKIHGQVQYVLLVIPCMQFLMTPLNQRLSQLDHPVGLGKGSKIREVLERMVHITVVVPPHLLHYHGTLDAATIGASGVWLPGTHFIWPTIWRLKWPPDIELAVREGRLSMADCESGAYFVQECLLLDHLLNGQVARVSTHNFSDNTPMVGWITRHTSGGESPFTEEMLHCLGIWQLITGRGPADCTHWPGKENLMGNIPLRSFKEGFPKGMDNQFLAHITNHFPLPTPFMPDSQPGSWKLVTAPSGIISAMILLLRKTTDMSKDLGATIGDSGYAIPCLITRTLASSTYKENPAAWNESSCSWPLLDPSGKVNSTMLADLLPVRSSRLHYEKLPGSWTVGSLATLGAALQDSPSWMQPF
jgi:hypothetical protein